MCLAWLGYFLIFIFLIFALLAEYSDLYCPHPKCKNLCRKGHGMPYYHGIGKEDDDFDVLLNKIKLTVRYENNSVKWRRAIIIAFIITLILIPLLYCRLADLYEIIIIFIVVYLALYLCFIFYNDTLSSEAVEVVDKNCKLLRQKINYV